MVRGSMRKRSFVKPGAVTGGGLMLGYARGRNAGRGGWRRRSTTSTSAARAKWVDPRRSKIRMNTSAMTSMRCRLCTR